MLIMVCIASLALWTGNSRSLVNIYLKSKLRAKHCANMAMQYIEDIYFFEVNTKYISSSELKTSEFSRVKIPMFSTHEMKYFGIYQKKVNFLFMLYVFDING